MTPRSSVVCFFVARDASGLVPHPPLWLEHLRQKGAVAASSPTPGPAHRCESRNPCVMWQRWCCVSRGWTCMCCPHCGQGNWWRWSVFFLCRRPRQRRVLPIPHEGSVVCPRLAERNNTLLSERQAPYVRPAWPPSQPGRLRGSCQGLRGHGSPCFLLVMLPPTFLRGKFAPRSTLGERSPANTPIGSSSGEASAERSSSFRFIPGSTSDAQRSRVAECCCRRPKSNQG